MILLFTFASLGGLLSLVVLDARVVGFGIRQELGDFGGSGIPLLRCGIFWFL